MDGVGKLFSNLVKSRFAGAGFLLVIALAFAGAGWFALNTNAASGSAESAVPVTVAPIDTQRADLAEITQQAKQFTAVIESDVAPQTAKQRNDAVAFSSRPLTGASPFMSRLEGADRLRAEACLAVAAIYEAGFSRDDQRPVMQVILNRVRHPAWPNSICEVVFQGSERSTGCQFSFTCDGSMQRRKPSDAQFEAARTLAAGMLDEETDPRVGWSTHYHTDWVYPYWSPNLDKSASVKTHIFFRWNGWWGTRNAFSARPSSIEPAIASVAVFDRWHEEALDEDGLDSELLSPEIPVSAPNLTAAEAALTVGKAPGNIWAKPVVKPLENGMLPGRWALDAVNLCGTKTSCRVVGWSPGSVKPLTFTPESLARNPPDIVYKQELRTRTQQVYWNCSKWPKAGTSQCLGNPRQAATLSLAIE